MKTIRASGRLTSTANVAAEYTVSIGWNVRHGVDGHYLYPTTQRGLATRVPLGVGETSQTLTLSQTSIDESPWEIGSRLEAVVVVTDPNGEDSYFGGSQWYKPRLVIGPSSGSYMYPIWRNPIWWSSELGDLPLGSKVYQYDVGAQLWTAQEHTHLGWVTIPGIGPMGALIPGNYIGISIEEGSAWITF